MGSKRRNASYAILRIKKKNIKSVIGIKIIVKCGIGNIGRVRLKGKIITRPDRIRAIRLRPYYFNQGRIT